MIEVELQAVNKGQGRGGAVGKRGGLERAVEGQGGASNRRTQGPEGRAKTQRATLQAVTRPRPAAVKRFQAYNALLKWCSSTSLKFMLRKWSSAPAGCRSWW